MDRQQQIQALGSLYLLYKSHSAQLQAIGHSKTEAFWLSFACLPFLPWSEQAEDRLYLSQVFRLYLGIYRYNTGDSLKPETIPAFLELLVGRYRMARDLAAIQEASRLETELGRFTLPTEPDPAKRARAAAIVLHTIAEWQEQKEEDCLPYALVEDIDGGSAA